MDEKNEIGSAPDRPPSSHPRVRPRRYTYASSCYSGDEELDVYQAIDSPATPTNPFDSVEDPVVEPIVQKKPSQRRTLAICASIIVAIVILSITTGLLIWHFRHGNDANDTSADRLSTSWASVPTTGTPFYTDRGPEMHGTTTSDKITSASFILTTMTPAILPPSTMTTAVTTITPPASTVTMTANGESTSF